MGPLSLWFAWQVERIENFENKQIWTSNLTHSLDDDFDNVLLQTVKFLTISVTKKTYEYGSMYSEINIVR